MKVKKINMHDAASRGFSIATDLADWFVRDLGMPFREAHALTGKFVSVASEKRIKLSSSNLRLDACVFENDVKFIFLNRLDGKTHPFPKQEHVFQPFDLT